MAHCLRSKTAVCVRSLIVSTFPFKGKDLFCIRRKQDALCKSDADGAGCYTGRAGDVYKRQVWPYHNEWYWANGTAPVAGQLFGFNLGCGFGDTSKATENMLFYSGKVTKLGRVHFDLGTAYMKPWHLYDDEGRRCV